MRTRPSRGIALPQNGCRKRLSTSSRHLRPWSSKRPCWLNSKRASLLALKAACAASVSPLLRSSLAIVNSVPARLSSNSTRTVCGCSKGFYLTLQFSAPVRLLRSGDPPRAGWPRGEFFCAKYGDGNGFGGATGLSRSADPAAVIGAVYTAKAGSLQASRAGAKRARASDPSCEPT